MKKQIIPTTNPLGNGVTQWDDPNMVGPQVPDNVRELYEETKTGGGFSWNNLVSHLGDIFDGIGSIVGNANSYSRETNTNTTNHTVNETNGSFSFSNGTTLTVIILGGIAVIITLILILGKK